MSVRKRERFLTTAAGALVALALVAGLNVLTRFARLRLDLSEGRVYSLTKASKDILSRLSDPVVVEAYFSPDLPPQYAASRDYLENLLREYAAWSKGKFRYEFVRAADPAKFEEQAVAAGIYPVQFNTLERDSYVVRKAYMGLTLRYLDKKETLPFLQDPAGLEYDVTSRIRKMTQERRKAVALVGSNGAKSAERLPRSVRVELEEAYSVTELDLEAATAPVSGVDALVLLGPEQRLSDRAVYRLDQYMLSGGAVLIAMDSKRVEMRNFMAAPLDTGLDGWLKGRGVELRKNLVLDRQNQKVSITSQQAWMTVQNIVDYPPFVLSTALDTEHPAAKAVDSLTLPFVSPVDVGSSRVDLQACKLEYSIVSPK